jgi:hypothetical protein
MTFLRSHLNEEGYILYRWLRLRWSRRRRERSLRGRTHIVMPKLSAAASERLVKSLENNTAAFTVESQTDALRRVGLLPVIDPPPPQPCKSCLAVFGTHVYTHGDCGVKPANYYAYSVPEVKHAQPEEALSTAERLALLGSMADAHERIGTPQNRARISDLGRMVGKQRR